MYLQVQDNSSTQSGFYTINATVDTEYGSYSIPNLPISLQAPAPYYSILSTGSGDIPAVHLGLTLTSNSPDYTINYLGLGYIDVESIAMSSDLINGQILTE